MNTNGLLHPDMPLPPGPFAGTLHIHVAFDWGDEIDLDHARKARGTSGRPLPRRRRTPTSIEYRPPPVRFDLEPVSLELPEIGTLTVPAEVALFDFAGVSLHLRVPFYLDAAALAALAGYLADPDNVVRAARAALEPLHQDVLPGIRDPHWSRLSEEYFVFALPPGPPLSPADLLGTYNSWLAGLVRLETGPLSEEEIGEALRRHLSYSPEDLFVADWPAAFLMDRDCEETLLAIEFANLQLLEYRQIDDRLDDSLTTAYGLVRLGPRKWTSIGRTHAGPLRLLGELKVEANDLFERTGNVLKLVGDQYLARLYRQLAGRFHLQQWEHSIQRKLETLEGIYTILADQAHAFRAEVLELTVILLILVEIVLAIWRH